MKNLFPLLCLGLLLVSCAQEPEETENHRAPNFVVLFADDLGYGDLASYGHPTISTPNLDRMADEGVSLTQFYSAASICTPSRAGLLTGRLPIRTGMCGGRGVLFPDSAGGLSQEEITLARALKKQGYATACIGKWHLGHQHPYLPTDHGFDYYFGIPYSNDMSPAQNDWEGAQAFPPLPLMQGDQVIEREPDQSLLTSRYTAEALQFMEDHHQSPFFLYLPYTFPHVPLYASDKFRGESRRGLYGDVVEELDWSVGEILSKIEELNLQQDTLVLFTSDNGPWLVMGAEGGSAGLLRGGKGSTWEGGMREPAIFWWPGRLPEGKILREVATTLDLFPTLTRLAGWEGQVAPLDGEDILPLLEEGRAKEDTTTYFYRGRDLYAIRMGPWKAHFRTIEEVYVSNRVEDHDPPLLFHLERDPSETRNLAEQHPEVIAGIEEIRKRHIEGLEAPPTRLAERLEVSSPTDAFDAPITGASDEQEP